MKILIGYFTKTGTTAKCAAMLGKQFHNHEVLVASLASEAVDLTEFDVVLLGASVRFGRLDKRFRAFLKANAARLAEKKTGYFMCCGAVEQSGDVFAHDIPRALLDAAVVKSAFGGELEISAQKGFFGKVIVWMMRRSIKNGELDEDLCYTDHLGLPEVLPDAIARFADDIKRDFVKRN